MNLNPSLNDISRLISDDHDNKVLKKMNIRHYILRWNGKKPESNILGAARLKRYELMTNRCIKYNIKYLLVAHHLDDQIENFFMRLVRGSGLKGLSSMSKSVSINRVKVIRPLLEYQKKSLIKVLANNMKNIPLVLKRARAVGFAAKKNLPVMTAVETIGSGMQKLHAGLYAFIEKPVMPSDIEGLETVMIALGTAVDSIDVTAGMKLGGAVDSIFSAITTATEAGGNAKDLAQVKVIVDALANFTGGNIVVTSDLPDKFNIHLKVDIDSQVLGRAIVARNLSTGGKADYISTGETKSVLGA